MLNWPLVFVFFLGEGGGDFLHGTDIGSGVFFMAKATFFPLLFTPLRVTSPGGLAESSWPVRSTRKYIPCEFFLFCTGTHPFSGKEGTKRPTLPYGFFSTTYSVGVPSFFCVSEPKCAGRNKTRPSSEGRRFFTPGEGKLSRCETPAPLLPESPHPYTTRGGAVKLPPPGGEGVDWAEGWEDVGGEGFFCQDLKG